MKKFCLIILTLVGINSFAQDLEKGYYYDLEGNKIKGEFKLTDGDFGTVSKVVFYTPDGEKLKLKPKMIKSAVLGPDSFIVLPHYYSGGLLQGKNSIALVYYTGPINIYKHRKRTINAEIPLFGSYTTYSLENKNTCILNVSGKQNNYGISSLTDFRTVFLPMISDFKELTNRISNMKKDLWIQNLPTFVRDYNQWKLEN